MVWSDQVNKVPHSISSKYSPEKVQFEIHSSDKLSNRFLPLTLPPTDGILSIDDDLLISCSDLANAHRVWLSNQQ